ncbi:hypothetical protein NPIL_416801 [Nephila pilipes]|uniref:Uncharacterized protein n=1 Tax=Nephila pilipes TaxID=299642 RepID=A0A8X6MW51_NEPPI|nr:hypothetical protein NPIL_416801 [Nephila pilipes]
MRGSVRPRLRKIKKKSGQNNKKEGSRILMTPPMMPEEEEGEKKKILKTEDVGGSWIPIYTVYMRAELNTSCVLRRVNNVDGVSNCIGDS